MKHIVLAILIFIVGCATPLWGGATPYYNYYLVDLDANHYMIFNAARKRLNKVIGYEYIGIAQDESSAHLIYSVNYKDDVPGYFENLLGMYYVGDFYTKHRIRILEGMLPAKEYKVVVHEMMHALGLEHNSNPKSVMYDTLYGNGENQDITPDDEKEIITKVVVYNKIRNESNNIERTIECQQEPTTSK